METNDKLEIREDRLGEVGSIVGVFPAGQGLKLSTDGQTYYRVFFGGVESYVSHGLLESIFNVVTIEPEAAPEVKDEPLPEPKASVIKKVADIVKKKPIKKTTKKKGLFSKKKK